MSPAIPESTYVDFLKAKAAVSPQTGFDVSLDDLHPTLYRHQKMLVKWALKGGCRAVFAKFGVGKSIIQLEILRQIRTRHDGPVLIVCPLGVRLEFANDAKKIDMATRFIRRDAEVDREFDGAYITNYESVRDGKLNPAQFTAVTLDEASILRSYGSKTYQEFLPKFTGVQFRFVATATPSPNRFKELIHYAGFLGVMDTGQALTRFFQRDSTKANNLKLYPHKEREFWLWLNTWAAFVQSPADLGCDATGYDLPPLDVEFVEVDVSLADDTVDRDGQGHIFRSAELGLKEAAREKRISIDARINKMKELVCEHIRSEGVPEAVLPEESREDAGSAEGARREEGPRGEASLSARVLPSESRETSGAAAGAREAELRGEAGGVFAEIQEVTPENAVQPDRGRVPEDALGTGLPLRDMRVTVGEAEIESPVAGGSRPRNRGGSRPALPSVQLGSWDVRGRHGQDAQGDRLPPQIVIWCHLNDEQRAIERGLEELGLTYSSVHGALDPDEVERRLTQWRRGETYALIGKPIMLGQGMNLQQASTAIFVGIDYSFNSTIQAVHRIHRYGQDRTCRVYLIHSNAETGVVAELKRKWQQHEELTETMTDVIHEHGLDPEAIAQALVRSMGIDRIEASGEGWTVANNDCVEETRAMPENNVDLIVTSIPFSNHYEYTPSYNDFGHTDNNDHFWEQMDFLTPELHRILKPGRIYACHVKDRILFGSVTGAGVPTVSPFHAEALTHGLKHGFDYMGMITVVTDVVRENNQTYRLGWSENAKDGTKMGVGSPEYILLFHKPQTDRTKGYADTPVTKDKDDYTRAHWQVDAHAFWREGGNRHLTTDELAALPPEQLSRTFTEQTMREVYDYESHIKIGEDLEGRGKLPATFMSLAPGSWHPEVWHDINRMLTLNTEQSRRAQQMHVCPLQFDIVDRLIERYSNPGDLVFDPFGGLATVPLRALKAGRRGRSVELNTGYFLDSVKYLEAEERKRDMPSLFDFGTEAA